MLKIFLHLQKVVVLFCIAIFSFSSTAEELTESVIVSLKKTPILNTIPMRDFLVSKNQKAEFCGEVYLITLQDGKKAVFKPVPPDDLGDAHAEVAAFKASQLLGFPNVPPTVIRKINNKIGSLQLYIEPSIDTMQPGVYENILSNSSPEEIANLKLFYFVFGQWDTGRHNIIVQKEQEKIKLYAIDNSGIRQRQYVKYGSLPFVRVCYSDTLTTNDWHLPFPYESEKVIDNPTPEKISSALGSKFPKLRLKNFSNERFSFHYIIYKNSLWVKFHASEPNFVLSYTKNYPEDAIMKLKRLDISALQKIFSEAKGSDFLTKDFLNAILERRDQVVHHYENQKILSYKLTFKRGSKCLQLM